MKDTEKLADIMNKMSTDKLSKFLSIYGKESVIYNRTYNYPSCKMVGTLLGLLSVAIISVFMFEPANQRKHIFNDKKIIIVRDNFEFIPAEKFNSFSMYIDDSKIEVYVEKMVKMIEDIERIPYQKHSKILDPSKLGYLLKGYPGTGKTLFTKIICNKLNEKLKLQHAIRIFGPEIVEIAKTSKAMKDLLLSNIQTQVLFLNVGPSDINNWFIGNSEKNIKKIFTNSDDIIRNGDAKAVVIMFDEGEALFRKRSSMMGLSRNSIVSELLGRISSHPIDGLRPVFVFTATNMADSYDSAFERRFGEHIEFAYPTAELRRELISSIVRDKLDLLPNEFELLVKITDGLTQAIIMKVLKEHIVISRNGRPVGLRFEDLYLEYKRIREEESLIKSKWVEQNERQNKETEKTDAYLKEQSEKGKKEFENDQKKIRKALSTIEDDPESPLNGKYITEYE